MVKQVGLMDFISEIEKNLGKTAEKNFLPMHPADSQETWSDTTKLRNHTGWIPTTSSGRWCIRIYRVGINLFIK